MHKILQTWQEQYYTVLIQDIIVLVTLVISIRNRKKFKVLKYIPFYAFFLFFNGLVAFLAFVREELDFSGKILFGVGRALDYLFTLLEMTIFSHLFYRLNNSNVVKSAIVIINICFIAFFIYMAIADRNTKLGISATTRANVYTIEGILLLLLCSYYFITFFKKSAVSNLKNDPVFWILVGLFSFMVCTLPYSLLENYISRNFPDFRLVSYSIFHIFYIIFFLLIIRAYLCPPEKRFDINSSA